MDRVVLFDGYCSFCRASQRVVNRMDWLRALTWLPFQRAEAASFGIPKELLEQRMYLVIGSRQWSGFAAWKQILVRLPILYIAILATALTSAWFLLAWLLFFLPATSPVGERVYDWIARNRYRVPGSTCELR